ncbi:MULTISPECIES: type II and III secretion system protein family protein [Pseudomonas]|jgi:pilus assembly protein CpaC|uniref:Pilus assembly protein CpaC n=1 Tax=Pseudomonas extremorientalis TaxID=169669 RepID=A0A1H0LCL0_9PSED|nr:MULTISPECIES: type II and III secretion system protein family protein [Pseudomonas]KAB0520540.1 type II and III secretion system protein family protein [Pseudomonas extremorientalis]OIN05164.1 type II and III secretion system protein RhcC2 [Pseudomonas extremorientalis]QZP23539.1 type II and III secretion system protein family protein [Pseudomonas sp. DR208]UUN86666.1 type II and III secretion system protein family protein [Pseudomonas extremorientalis]WLG54531.1 type II and III secretion s
MMRFCALLLTVFSCVSQAQEIAAGAGGSIALASGEGRILHFVAPVDTVLVAEPNVADLQVVSPGTLYIFGKAPGNTSLIALGSDGQQLASLSLAVSSASQAVTAPMQALHPGNAAQISGAGNRLIAKGTVGSVAEATDLNALLNPQGQGFQSAINTTEYAGAAQVNLRVRFAEVSRSELLHYGVNWNAMFNNGTFSFGLITGGPLAAASAGGLAAAGAGSGNVNIDGMLDALQANGVLQILAEPNITAMTGQTASFLAGGEVAIPVPVNRDLVGIEYKSFGVSLLFNPTLLPNGRIALQVRPEVSSVVSGGTVDFGNFHVPSFSVRRADTRVEVGSGQTFAIAGLFQRESSQDIEKLPLLGDLPILGNLFRSKRFQRNETELVILITPYLVEPVRGRTLATPLDAPPATAAATGPRSGGAFGFYMN